MVLSYFEVCFSLVQLAGFVSVAALCAARRCAFNRVCERVFLILLAIVSLSAIWALGAAKSQWVFACPTMAAMVVGATLDLSSHRDRREF